MNDLIKLQRLDERFRMVCGMYAMEKKRAEKLAQRIKELEEENCKLRTLLE